MGVFKGNILKNLSKSVGNFVNDITGVSQSAKQQYEYESALQKSAQDYTTWQMSNAHQLETQDLKSAGINPVVSGAGSGAGGTVSPGATGSGTSGGDPISLITDLINTMNNSAKTEADIKKVGADIKKIKAETKGINIENKGHEDNGTFKDQPKLIKLWNHIGGNSAKSEKMKRQEQRLNDYKNGKITYWKAVKENAKDLLRK